MSRPSIKVYNVSLREDAEPLCRLFEGKTYMNLEVGVAPAGGSFDVWVSTCRPNISETELRGMVMSVLVSCALDMGSVPVLRVLAEGCSRLEDGDLNDCRAARVTDARVLEHFGQVRNGLNHESKAEVSSGYIMSNTGGDGVYTWVDGQGNWTTGDESPSKGVLLYMDRDCTVELRAIS